MPIFHDNPPSISYIANNFAAIIIVLCAAIKFSPSILAQLHVLKDFKNKVDMKYVLFCFYLLNIPNLLTYNLLRILK